MNILIVSQYFWPESFRINDLALELRNRGHHVSVLTGQPNYPDGRVYEGHSQLKWRDEFEGIPVARVPLLPRGSASGTRLAANYLSFAASASALGPWLCRGQQVDVILSFVVSPVLVGWPAIVMKKWKRAPLALWLQDLWPESLSATGHVHSPLVLGAVDRVVRQIYRHSDLLLIQSPGFREVIEQQGVDPARIAELPNWAEDLYQPVSRESAAAEDRELPEGFRLMFAGNIGSSQSMPTIVQAAALCRDEPRLKWIIVGDGHERAAVEQQIREQSLEQSVHLIGRRPMESMPRYFAAADAMLMTLRRNPIFARTIPSRLQSYLACGRPVLGSVEGTPAEVIRQADAGLVAPPEDPVALAAAARQMLHSSEAQHRQWQHNALSCYRQHFSRGMLLDRLEQLAQALAAGKKGPFDCGSVLDNTAQTNGKVERCAA